MQIYSNFIKKFKTVPTLLIELQVAEVFTNQVGRHDNGGVATDGRENEKKNLRNGATRPTNSIGALPVFDLKKPSPWQRGAFIPFFHSLRR
jgi:hypothetical protein